MGEHQRAARTRAVLSNPAPRPKAVTTALLPGGTAHPRIAAALNEARGGGTPLTPASRGALAPLLGSSLADVRVHADPPAHALARSVAARAFAVGPDVYFAEGEYRPGTPGGDRLIAHELTHVVQQRGAAAGGALRVADRGGPAEREAQAVAAAAVAPRSAATERGGRAPTRPAVTGHAPVAAIQRTPAADLDEMAEAGEAQAAADRAHDVNQPPAARVSNVHDVGAARALAERLEGYRGHMQEGAGAGGAFTVSELRVTPPKMQANEQAIGALDDYLVTAGEQTRTLGSFQDALQKARTDYERLRAQVTHLTVANRIARGATAGEMGEQLVRGAGLGDPDAARARLQRLQTNPALLAAHTQVQTAHDQMIALGQQVGTRQSAVSTSAYNYMGALNAFKTGVPTVNDNPDQAKELKDLKEQIERVKKYVGKGLEYAGKGLEAAGVKGAEKAGAAAGPAVEWLTDQFYDAELNGIQSKINMYNTAHREHAITATLDAARAGSRAFTAAVTEFSNAVEAFAHAQTTFRDQIRAFGRAADAGHGDKYAQIASVLAEVDTYETQLDDALRLAYQEQTAAAEAASARRTAEGGANPGGAPRTAGMPYYEPFKTYHINGGWGYECSRNELHLQVVGSSRGSAEGVANVGVNATVEQAIRDLQTFRAEVDPMRRALARAMDLRMDGAMPVPAGAPAPTPRGANTGL